MTMLDDIKSDIGTAEYIAQEAQKGGFSIGTWAFFTLALAATKALLAIAYSIEKGYLDDK